MSVLCNSCKYMDLDNWDCKKAEDLSLEETILFYQDYLVYECSSYVNKEQSREDK